MNEFKMVDTVTIPATAAAYTKKTFLANAGAKWFPAGLIAVLTDLSGAFTELFFWVIVLWLCDFLIGFSRALVDEDVKVEYIKILRSVVKLFVIAIGVVAMHAMEGFLLEIPIDTHQKLTVTLLLVVGIAEIFSILDNLCYWWPGLGVFAKRLKGLLGKANKTGDSNGQVSRRAP